MDVLTSAFASAGQRCSALRVLFLQRDVAARVIRLLKGAMAELSVGDPALLTTDVAPSSMSRPGVCWRRTQSVCNETAGLSIK